MKANFCKKISEWLRVFVSFKETKQSSEKSRDLDQYSSEFAESSDRTKRRRTDELRAGNSTEVKY